MKALIQRVAQAGVTVADKEVSSIGKGYLILLGVMKGDGPDELKYIATKTANLRVFYDEAGKMNLSLKDIPNGEALVVSQFTLAADTGKGNRPSFMDAESPETAERMYEEFMVMLRAEGIGNVKGGIFGADMKVSLINDGPVTIMLDTAAK